MGGGAGGISNPAGQGHILLLSYPCRGHSNLESTLPNLKLKSSPSSFFFYYDKNVDWVFNCRQAKTVKYQIIHRVPFHTSSDRVYGGVANMNIWIEKKVLSDRIVLRVLYRQKYLSYKVAALSKMIKPTDSLVKRH